MSFALLRLIFGASAFVVSLLAVFRAPTNLLWKLAVGVTEWGHMLALLAVLFLLPGWGSSWSSRTGAALCLAAAVLSLTPLTRAVMLVRRLPSEIPARFIASPPLSAVRAPARPSPLVAGDLFVGIRPPHREPRSLVYDRVESGELRLDFYPPFVANGPAPVVLVIHGGSWNGGNSKEFLPLNDYLSSRGYAVAAVNYRLAPRFPFPAARDDVKRAIAFLQANADTLGLDPKRFALLGRSAGGQLALLVAYTAEDPAIRGVVSFYAPTDLRWSYQNPGNPLVRDTHGILEAYLGGRPDQVHDIYDTSSPIQFVDQATPPTLLIHGSRDEVVSPLQSERLAARLQAAGVPYFLLRLPWATHGLDFIFRGPGGQISTYMVERFLAAILQ